LRRRLVPRWRLGLYLLPVALLFSTSCKTPPKAYPPVPQPRSALSGEVATVMTLQGLGPLECVDAGGDVYEVNVSADEIENYLGRIEVYRKKIDALRAR
jgi:hypothetical protein